MINIDIAYEFIRMHRPWMGESEPQPTGPDNAHSHFAGVAGVDSAFKYSQLQAIKYSRILLSLYQSPSCNRLRWNGLLHKATSVGLPPAGAAG